MTDLTGAIDWLLDFTWDADIDEEDIEDFTEAQFQNWRMFSRKSQKTLIDIVRMTIESNNRPSIDISEYFQ